MAGTASPPVRLGLAQTLVVATWFGVITGVVEVIHQAIRQMWFGSFRPGPDEVIWLVPTCHLLCFAVLGLVVWLLGALVRRLPGLDVVVFVCTLATVWSQFMLHPRFAGIAAFLLSVGVAVQVARTAGKRRDGFLTLCRRTAPVLVTMVVLVAVGQPIVQGMGERSRLAALPPARADSPNVLLIVLDTVRAENLEVYGHRNETAPTVRKVAEKGAVFERAVSSSSWTVPGHATMFTGRYSHELNGSTWMAHLDGRFPTLAEVLSRHGYATGGFVGNVNYCCSERGFGRGFTRYEDFQVNPITAALSFSFGDQLILGAVPEGHIARFKRNDAATVTSRFMSWLDDRGDRPFFAFLNYFDAHALYLPPPGYDDLFGPRPDHLEDWRSRLRDWTPEEMEGYERAYDGCIRYIDDHVELILDRLDAEGELENTIVVITADHGEHFGEKGLVSHANSLYRAAIHVPLIISYPPSVPEGERISTTVSLRDLPRTILDLCGVEPRRAFPGASLAQLWDGTSVDELSLSPAVSQVAPAGGPRGKPDWWPIKRGTLRSLTEGDVHFIRAADGHEELFQWNGSADEDEHSDAAELQAMRAKLHAVVNPRKN